MVHCEAKQLGIQTYVNCESMLMGENVGQLKFAFLTWKHAGVYKSATYFEVSQRKEPPGGSWNVLSYHTGSNRQETLEAADTVLDQLILHLLESALHSSPILCLAVKIY